MSISNAGDSSLGPLEAFEQAIDAYEAALALQPELARRTHRTRPACCCTLPSAGAMLWPFIVRSSHRLPDHRESLRAIAQIAEQRGATDVADGARVVLRTLGLASPEEENAAGGALRLAIHPGPPMADDEHERLRRIAHQIREELEPVLRDEITERAACSDDATEQAIRSILSVEDELSAPGLTRLAPDQRHGLFGALAALFLDPGGNGSDSRFRDTLDGALGRWTRRKVRRIVEETTIEAIDAVDPEAWGDALRSIAAAQVVDRNGGDLTPVLRGLILLEAESSAASAATDEAFQPPHLDGAAIGTLASSSNATRRLLARVAEQLCDRLENGR